MTRALLLWASRNRWMRERFTRAGFVRRAVSRFMPGETAGAALDAAGTFDTRGIGTVLTLLGEDLANPAETAAVVTHYSGLLDTIATRGLHTEISVKLTQLGLALDPGIALANLESIARAADARRALVWVDMEGSAWTQATLDLFRRARAGHSNLGLCLQAYLYRTSDDLDALLTQGAAIRLVKGAYAEPRTLAIPGKAEVDANYLKLAERLLDASSRVAFATHDGRLIRQILDAAGRRGRPKGAVEFQMLYGIRRAEQDRLAAEGHRVRVLISYGSAWFAWYMRRLAERPANLWFVAKSTFGG
jgi:proline dehydrogenase